MLDQVYNFLTMMSVIIILLLGVRHGMLYYLLFSIVRLEIDKIWTERFIVSFLNNSSRQISDPDGQPYMSELTSVQVL